MSAQRCKVTIEISPGEMCGWWADVWVLIPPHHIGGYNTLKWSLSRRRVERAAERCGRRQAKRYERSHSNRSKWEVDL